ncbi:MAG: ParB N-terminal domain-containing protein [Pseudomonadota bacterium]
MIALETIHIDLIDRTMGSRRVDPAWVNTIAETIIAGADVAPIDVIEDGDRYRQIVGQHRLEAAIAADEVTIEARVFPADHFASEDEITLHQLQENMVRRQLSVLDRAISIESMKDIYERQHPNAAKHGGRRVKAADDNQAAKLAACFSETAQATLAMSERSIQRALKIAAAFDPAARKALALLPISDIQSDLETLAGFKPKDREALIKLLADDANEIDRLSDAMDRHFKRVKPPKMSSVEVASVVFEKLETKDRFAFFDTHADEIDAWMASR